jgi:hypothetical protein
VGATRPPEGGAERSEIVQWTISAKHARPVAAPGVQAPPDLTGVKSGESVCHHLRKIIARQLQIYFSLYEFLSQAP